MGTITDYFGSLVFDDRAIKATLSSKVYASLKKTIDEGTELDSSVANAVAATMKDWAVSKGATHYTSRLPASPHNLGNVRAAFRPSFYRACRFRPVIPIIVLFLFAKSLILFGGAW